MFSIVLNVRNPHNLKLFAIINYTYTVVYRYVHIKEIEIEKEKFINERKDAEKVKNVNEWWEMWKQCKYKWMTMIIKE